ncbi:MAG: hypothetical protein ACRDWI_02045 [Jiangellaceae bacterium]
MPDSPPPDRPDPYAIPHPDDGSDNPPPAAHPSADRSTTTPGTSPQRNPEPPGPDAARHARLLGMLGVLAVLLAVLVPLVGVVLGGVTVVIGARHRSPARFLRLPVRGMAMTTGGIALVVGAALSLVSVLIGDELDQLRQCLAGANTRVAEQNCQDEFSDALERRLPGLPGS